MRQIDPVQQQVANKQRMYRQFIVIQIMGENIDGVAYHEDVGPRSNLTGSEEWFFHVGDEELGGAVGIGEDELSLLSDFSLGCNFVGHRRDSTGSLIKSGAAVFV